MHTYARLPVVVGGPGGEGELVLDCPGGVGESVPGV